MSLRREQQAELERIFYDFMDYYKYKAPHYKVPYHTLPFYFLTPYRSEEYTLDPRATKMLKPATTCDINETFPVVYTPNPEAYDDNRVDKEQTEQMYYKALFDNLNKALLPYVEDVIKDNDYEGSPINDKYFSKESLAQLVSQILDKAKENPALVDFVNDLDPKVRELMKNIVQALLLGELFIVHRPNTNLNDKNLTTMPYDSTTTRYSNHQQHNKPNIYTKDSIDTLNTPVDNIIKTKTHNSFDPQVSILPYTLKSNLLSFKFLLYRSCHCDIST